MPKGANLLTVQVQREVPCIWAEVDTDAPASLRIFEQFGTGNPMLWEIGVKRSYLGSYQIGGAFIFHVYERFNPGEKK